MACLVRVVMAGIPHHVTQRGNRREDVFRSDADWCSSLETEGEQQTAAVRRQTHTGRPCGDEGFVNNVTLNS
jgi:hypothetical protein